jgi:hypothetical protein
VWPVVIVVVLPLSQLVIEQVNVVRNTVTVEQLVELLVVDPVRALDLAFNRGVLGRMYAWRISRSCRCQ